MDYEWSPDLLINVEEIDNQHKELFQRIGSLRAAIRNGQGRGGLLKTIDFLEEYVNVHFNAEEALMQRYNYPGLLSQQTEHSGFLKDFEDFKEKLRELENEGEFSSFLAIEIERRLGAWLVNHVGTLDKQLGVFLADKL